MEISKILIFLNILNKFKMDHYNVYYNFKLQNKVQIYTNKYKLLLFCTYYLKSFTSLLTIKNVITLKHVKQKKNC